MNEYRAVEKPDIVKITARPSRWETLRDFMQKNPDAKWIHVQLRDTDSVHVVAGSIRAYFRARGKAIQTMVDSKTRKVYVRVRPEGFDAE